MVGQRITVEDVNQLLGTASEERLVQLAGHLVARDSAGGGWPILMRRWSRGSIRGNCSTNYWSIFAI